MGGAILAVAGLLALAIGLVISWWAAPVGFAVAAVVLWFAGIAPRVARAEDRVLALVGPHRDADAFAEARLLNLVDGLVPATGLGRPRCLVIEDETRNLLVVGRNARHSRLVITTGLLEAATRMELEGAVACALVAIRDDVAAAPTLALAIGGARLLGYAGQPPDAAAEDLAAVMLTRYPPGLAATFRRILEGGGPCRAARSDPVVDRLWLAVPGDPAALAARAEVLEEL